MSFGGLYYPAYTPGLGSKPRFQSTHPFRNLVAAGTNLNNQWSGGGGSAQSGYGQEPADYDYHSGPPAHVPSGGSYSYHSTTGTGYGPPPQPVHPPVKGPTGVGGGKKGGKRGSSAMSALTLLSFLFFINLLQGCIKDHMDAMNPTVMVMTTNVIRNRFNKMGEMNSREQNSSPSFSSNAGNIVMQPADLVAAAAAQSPAVMEATKTTVSLQSPYSVTVGRYQKPMEVPAQPIQPVYHNPEPEVQVNYAKPYYDPNQPDPYVNYNPQQQAQSPPQPPVTYTNHSLISQRPAYNGGPQLEQHYNYHHTEYHAQAPPSVITQYASTTTRYPHYEYQQPSFSNSYKENNDRQPPPPPPPEQPNKYQNKPPYKQTSQNTHPWSSHSSSMSSVVSGPFRRASIISVSPTTKWISVPAKISDLTSFVEEDEKQEEIEHHNDREVFHRRLN